MSELANSARTAPTPRRSESALSVASSTFTEIEPEQVERTVYALSSTSIQTVIDATSQLVHLFRDQNNHVIYMLEKADFIAKTIATQFSIIRTQHLNDRESDTNTNLLMRSLCNFLTFVSFFNIFFMFFKHIFSLCISIVLFVAFHIQH